MRRSLSFLLPLSLLLSACSFEFDSLTSPNPTTSASSPAEEPTVAAVFPPTDYMPVAQQDGECPYLDTQAAADSNGQKVLRVGLDFTLDPPACIFFTLDNQPQLTVLVRKLGDENLARQVVDWAAPISFTDPAYDPQGWDGGRFGGDGWSVYSVQKDGTAVSVWSNQEQSIKPQIIAETVIANLQL